MLLLLTSGFPPAGSPNLPCLEQLRVRVSPCAAVTPLRCRPRCGAVPISPGSAAGSAATRLLRGAPFSSPRVPTAPRRWGEPFPLPNPRSPLCPRSTAVGIGFYGNSETNDGVYQLLYALDNANHTLTGIDALVGLRGRDPRPPLSPRGLLCLPAAPPHPLWGEKKGAGKPGTGPVLPLRAGGAAGDPPQPCSRAGLSPRGRAREADVSPAEWGLCALLSTPGPSPPGFCHPSPSLLHPSAPPSVWGPKYLLLEGVSLPSSH